MQTTSDLGPPSAGGLSDRAAYAVVGAISIVALAVLAYILLIRESGESATADLRFMPAVNASLNGTAALLLVAGWRAIRAGRRTLHMYLMVAAFLASALFLVGYLAYHYVHGDTKYLGQGWLRPVYFFILISHILTSALALPLCLTTLFFALRRRFDRHRRIARIALPIWLYVSVTGVLVFFFLRASYG